MVIDRRYGCCNHTLGSFACGLVFELRCLCKQPPKFFSTWFEAEVEFRMCQENQHLTHLVPCCNNDLHFVGQGKHGHAAHRQGACSQICCGESPRALGQRVPLGDQKTLILQPSAKLFVELWFAVFGPLQQQSYAMSVCKNANRTGLTLSMPSFCM